MNSTPRDPFLFLSATEILDLCDSIKDIHRTLVFLAKFLKDLDAASVRDGQAVRNDFQRWGICHTCETFVGEQFQRLERIVESYKMFLAILSDLSAKASGKTPEAKEYGGLWTNYGNP